MKDYTIEQSEGQNPMTLREFAEMIGITMPDTDKDSDVKDDTRGKTDLIR